MMREEEEVKGRKKRLGIEGIGGKGKEKPHVSRSRRNSRHREEARYPDSCPKRARRGAETLRVAFTAQSTSAR